MTQIRAQLETPVIAVLGLGYVGLPLAVEFGKKVKTIGFDINQNRVSEVNSGKDGTLEVSESDLKSVLEKGLFVASADIQDLKAANVYIITVPTPTDKHNKPDLTPLKKASETIAKVISTGDIVIYESTVYPGVTEEECIPVIESATGMKFNEDFFAGYSPERINPGDKLHTVTKILKVTSGSTPEVADFVDELYRKVISAGTHKASSIKVAEAAKVIENSQRDINIAFVNELAKIFNKMGIDTHEVLEAAGTKWNFLPFKPGLVGGHCIGVDPYYLAQRAQEFGYHPEIILAGRRLNDSMGQFVADEVVKLMVRKDIRVKDSNIVMYGITFKENCPDIRNTRVIDIVKALKIYGANVHVYDPWANSKEVEHEFSFSLISKEDLVGLKADACVLAVAHQEFLEMDFSCEAGEKKVVYDVKGVLPKQIVDARL